MAERMPGLSTGLDDETPIQKDVFGDGQHPVRKHGPEAMVEPLSEFGTTGWFGDQFDAEPDLGKGHLADKETIQRLRADEVNDGG